MLSVRTRPGPPRSRRKNAAHRALQEFAFTAYHCRVLLLRPRANLSFSPLQLGQSLTRLVPASDPGKPWLAGFSSTDDTIALMLRYARGDEGERSARVRQWAEAIVRLLRPKDYLSEILAIRGWCTGPHLRYTNDARHVEQVKTPLRILNEIDKHGTSLVDCDDIATLIAALGMCLGRNACFTMAGFSQASDQYTHVFCRLQEPRSSTWIVCDPVAGSREAEMLSSVVRFKNISVDE